MDDKRNIHPNAPAGGGGPGNFGSAAPLGHNSTIDRWDKPGVLGVGPETGEAKLKINGVIAAGGPLSARTIAAVNSAAQKVPSQWRRYIAYADKVNVGGSLAWRANNPGNLRDSANKICSVSGAVGKFAVFATIEEGRTAQRELYLSKYGAMKVRDAINKLTPPNENDTRGYLALLEKAGVELNGDVRSQIDALMKAVEANEGLISGQEVGRIP